MSRCMEPRVMRGPSQRGVYGSVMYLGIIGTYHACGSHGLGPDLRLDGFRRMRCTFVAGAGSSLRILGSVYGEDATAISRLHGDNVHIGYIFINRLDRVCTAPPAARELSGKHSDLALQPPSQTSPQEEAKLSIARGPLDRQSPAATPVWSKGLSPRRRGSTSTLLQPLHPARPSETYPLRLAQSRTRLHWTRCGGE